MNKENVVSKHTERDTYTHNGIPRSHKKNEIMPSVIIWMNLKGFMQNEGSQRKTNTIKFHSYVGI